VVGGAGGGGVLDVINFFEGGGELEIVDCGPHRTVPQI